MCYNNYTWSLLYFFSAILKFFPIFAADFLHNSNQKQHKTKIKLQT